MGTLKISSPDGNVVGSATLNIIKNKILSIELLQGDTEETDAEVIQYVNLKHDVKDGTNIKHIDRLGRALKLKVTFENNANIKFKVKMLRDSGNVSYTSTEKARNSNFGYTESKEYNKTSLPNTLNSVTLPPKNNNVAFIGIDNKYKLNTDILVTPAGGDIFTIVAIDQFGNKVEAKAKVKTQRRLFYIEAKMTGLTNIASNLNTFETEFKKHGIVLDKLPAVQINHMKNIGTDAESNSFKNNVISRTSSKIANKIPNCVIIGYTDHLAVKEPNQRIRAVAAVGGSVNPINVPMIKQGSTSGKHPLWNNIIPGDDWFVECFFLKNGGTVADRIAINKAKCTLVQAVGYPIGYYDSVNVDISTLAADNGTIVMKTNLVNRMRGGLSFTGTNIVAICTKAWWQSKSNNDQNQVIIHEVGHQLGMVATGSGKLPDKTSYHYDDTKGHVGNHCHMGIPAGQARYDSRADGALSQCVMYGATNGKSVFCVECTKALRKVDLSSGV